MCSNDTGSTLGPIRKGDIYIMSQTNDFPEEEGFITLSLDGGKELECQVLTILEVNKKDYIVLYPLEESSQIEEGEVFIYRYFEDKNGEVDLQNIDSDEEFEMVSDAFDEYLDSCEFDEIVEAED